ncbi:hypothetical protein DYB32_004869 [Aphanomyces invadans]|uniref:Tr-type G domain-containing protein n=1 Tax=Aphanomyces invadans TaxID=157072 RepID=A0A418AW76_9STRA|nr:hypothetical protein DYB32_004869 [Aphanomyces invadans]
MALILVSSSAISLMYEGPLTPAERKARGLDSSNDEVTVPYLINLVDSPGHVDFSFDVSTAVRLCDGALVLIDVIEGVCAQTHAVLRQAWQEGIRPCLVLNKIDRLIYELQYTPVEAYRHICRIVERANVIISSMIRADRLDEEEELDVSLLEEDDDQTETLERQWMFSPAYGNVLFASAYDGWAFSIGYFAAYYSKKFETPQAQWRKGLWGDHYFHAKTKVIRSTPWTSSSVPMFVSFILEPLWSVYKTLMEPLPPQKELTADPTILEKLRQLTKVLNLICAIFGHSDSNRGAEVYVAVGRVFSGTLKADDLLYLLGPKYNGEGLPSSHVTAIAPHSLQLYMVMGADFVAETGEHVIVALGELHLERCVKDLTERFAKVPLRVSEPLVGFRETIAAGDANYDKQSIFNFKLLQLSDMSVGPNLLVNRVPDYASASTIFQANTGIPDSDPRSKFESSLITGFQLATASGPLCDEPVWGVAFVVEDVVLTPTEDASAPAIYGPLSGQVISTMKSGCRNAFIQQPVRLVEAMYLCTVQCHAEQLGKLYSVFAKRRAKVLSEELSDGSALFRIEAHLPVVESFGFATELLKSTSGNASNPQLIFDHWTIMEDDPFFQPQTDEEREDFGERIDEHNAVRRLIELVRKRKGLAREEKIVVHAEKQRTLGRNK